MTGVILCGGKSQRINGVNKGLLKIRGKTILETLIEKLSFVFDDLLLCVKSVRLDSERTEEYQEHTNLPVRLVSDLFPTQSALVGIYSALKQAKDFHSFITACDMPFLDIELVRHLMAELDGFDVVVPRTRKGLEPLYAFYSKNCLEPIEKQLQKGNFKITDFFPAVRLKVVNVEEIPELQGKDEIFSNINNRTDMVTWLDG